MPITTRHMAPGSWSVTLADDTPPSLRRLLTVAHSPGVGIDESRANVGLATLVVLPDHIATTDIDPTPGNGVHGILDLAEYSGLVWAADPAVPSLSGMGLAAWLGVDGRGELYVTAPPGNTAGNRVPMRHKTLTAWGWIDWMIEGGTHVMSHPIVSDVNVTYSASALGFLQSSGGTGPTFGWYRGDIATRAEVVTEACARAGWEWEVTADGRFRFGPASTMWPTPTAVIGPGLGDDPDWTVIDGRVERWETSMDGWANKAFATGEWGEGFTTEGYPWVRGSATGGGGYRDLKGKVPQWAEIIDGQDPDDDPESDGDWLGRSLGHLIETTTPGPYWASVAPEMTVSGGVMRRRGASRRPPPRPGQRCLVWDPLRGASDPGSAVTVAGEVIHPLHVRIASVTRPILDSHGVYLLRRSGASTWHPLLDLTEWVVPDSDSDDIRLEVGAPAPPITPTTSNRPRRNA